ncbi:hypothetical protein [Sphingomonas sp.]|uniref:hypothetical protein n=1 Tax=Sphingomonas sp. TaxID=28214 RepID=UPI000DB55D1B|nr:hypothetical protein [Sphingomonas sp.]PZU10180.1 MAG: hypothetical protein DI605_06200 [Sphingomonas sp.]
MGIANILAAAVGSLWALILLVGWGLYRGVIDQHVVGYPTTEQFHYYVVKPLVVLGILLLGTVVANRVKHGAIPLAAIAICAALYMMPHMMLFTGGM